ncbi:MAG TPA: hypothetical protein VJK30_07535 [Coxiellaceae bacterium]|nr:MAG: hypothetical protein A3E81_07385 [Gammaproteobacteria bacterium RIFCSPHIGHO2_12_FULL_36_30]HLB57160.1 hypothetical protein [Coxiellaceae bacterium]
MFTMKNRLLFPVGCLFILMLSPLSALAGQGWYMGVQNASPNPVTVGGGGTKDITSHCWYNDNIDQTNTVPAGTTARFYSEQVNSGDCFGTGTAYTHFQLVTSIETYVLGLNFLKGKCSAEIYKGTALFTSITLASSCDPSDTQELCYYISPTNEVTIKAGACPTEQ